MIPTDELKGALRKRLGEAIPDGGTDADTRFSDAEIEEYLIMSSCLYEACALGWMVKAGMYQSETDCLEDYTIGNRREKYTSLKDYQDYALKMSEQYTRLARVAVGSLILHVDCPEAL